MLFFDLLYLFIIILAVPLWIKVLLRKEYRSLLRHRLSPGIKPSLHKRIWIHAVSMGEVRSLKALINQLKDIYGDKEIVLSVSTPAGYKCAKSEYKNIIIINSPLDFSFVIRRYIKQINPEILILNELEMWPNWVCITSRKKIPILLINGRISEKAFKRYKRIRFLFKYFFNKIDRYLVQTELYNRRFQKLNIHAEKIKICGSIKADEAFNRLDSLPGEDDIFNLIRLSSIHRETKTIITLASSHEPDEAQLFPIINDTHEDFFFIIIPRHLNRLDSIERSLESFKIAFSTWSKSSKEDIASSKVLIFDQMGALFEVLKISDLVLMGGTFDPKTGGHNFYEPAVLGKLIIGGPHFNNFPSIGNELIECNAYRVVKNSSEYLSQINSFRSISQKDRETLKNQTIRTVSNRKGSIKCTLMEIQRIISRQK